MLYIETVDIENHDNILCERNITNLEKYISISMPEICYIFIFTLCVCLGLDHVVVLGQLEQIRYSFSSTLCILGLSGHPTCCQASSPSVPRCQPLTFCSLI